MEPTRPAVVVLKSRAQLDALVSPIRLEILEQFRDRRALAIADVARRMERSATSLTYHVAKLARAGILVRTGMRRSGGRSHSLYALAGERLAVGVRAGSRPALDAASRSIATMLRLAAREAGRALAAGCGDARRKSASPFVRRIRTRLTDADAESLARRLEELQEWLASCDGGRAGRPHAVTVVVVPLAPRGRRKESR
ncbi:MAG: helix-turn-helix transcriptional regulator [Acidobacteria bacterium]|nr:helix-turn-helix transcriptional regulator [Acidobacteriota bacterium]